MAAADKSTGDDEIPVIVFFKGHEDEKKVQMFKCKRENSLAQVREQWHAKLESTPSVAFFSAKNKFFPNDMTVAEALQKTETGSLELHARLLKTFWIELFGYEESRVQFELEPCLPPAVVRRQIITTLDLNGDDFRLICGKVPTAEAAHQDQSCVLDEEQAFDDLDCNLLTVDLKVQVNLRSDQDEGHQVVYCYGSETIGDLRQQIHLDENQVIVRNEAPYRRLLHDNLRLCHVVSDESELDSPIGLIIERKVKIAFEPITLEHLRQELYVPLSATPLDLYDEVSRRFELESEFRLAVHDTSLDNCAPLAEQLFDHETIIQIDIVRLFVVDDRWPDYFKEKRDDLVFLYSTESAFALTIRSVLDDQQLFYDGIPLTLFGRIVDVFGAIGGRCQPVLLVNRDVHRHVPFLLSDTIERRFAWAGEVVGDVAPTVPLGCPSELMSYGEMTAHKESMSDLSLSENALVTINPLKIVIAHEKRLRLSRLPCGSTFSDIRAHMEQALNNQNLQSNQRALDEEAINRKLELELLRLERSSRYRTRLVVTVKDKKYDCWFESSEVSFSDIMVEIGRQSTKDNSFGKEKSTRHLFDRSLFCHGCGRRVSKEEEPFQSVPAKCCSVRSLILTDRRCRDIGIQTAVPRSRPASTETLYPEERDASVNTELESTTVVVNATTQYECRTTQFYASLEGSQTGPHIMQSSSASRGTAKFHISCRFRDKETFDLDIPIEGELLGKELRSKISKKIQRKKKEFQLKQTKRRRKSDGIDMVAIGILTFADEEGNKVALEELENDRVHVIRDEEQVQTAGPQRAWIDVYLEKQ